MTITTLATALKAALNTATPGQLADMLRSIQLGNQLRSLPVHLYNQVPAAAAANPYVPAAAQSLTLPDDAKATFILKAFARAGTGTKGLLTVDNESNTGPIAGHIAVTASGDIMVNATDAWTAFDVLYVPAKYDTQEVQLPITAGNTTVTLPTNFGPGVRVFEAEILTGTSVGKKLVDIPGGTPAAGHAAMSFDGKTVLFAAADAGTTARVKYGTAPQIDINALLEAASNFF